MVEDWWRWVLWGRRSDNEDLAVCSPDNMADLSKPPLTWCAGSLLAVAGLSFFKFDFGPALLENSGGIPE